MCGSNLEIRSPEGTSRACPAGTTCAVASRQFEAAEDLDRYFDEFVLRFVFGSRTAMTVPYEN